MFQYWLLKWNNLVNLLPCFDLCNLNRSIIIIIIEILGLCSILTKIQIICQSTVFSYHETSASTFYRIPVKTCLRMRVLCTYICNTYTELSFSFLLIICYQTIRVRVWLTSNCLEQNREIRASSSSDVRARLWGSDNGYHYQSPQSSPGYQGERKLGGG